MLFISHVGKNGETSFLWIRDFLCGFNKEQLAEQAMRVASDWIEQVGQSFDVENKQSKHSIASFTQLICRKVNLARKQYLKDKEEWELKLAKAQQVNAKRKASDAATKAMIDWLVTEAQRYMVSGGRLRELRNIKPPGKTPAETWHLMNFEQFNKRSIPQQIHKEETKDSNGNIKINSWCENPGGGEIAAVVEQARFMLEGISGRAEKGSEEAMLWLYHLAMLVTQEFWAAVEAQPKLAHRMSANWQQVPIHWSDSLRVIKTARAKTKQLQMPKPAPVSLKVQPDSPYQQAVSRAVDALNYLMRSPPIFLPPMHDGRRSNLLDDWFPDWLKKAFELTASGEGDPRKYAEILWEVYAAAQTAKPDSPWKKQSRPRKAKEKFVQAFMARKAKTP